FPGASACATPDSSTRKSPRGSSQPSTARASDICWCRSGSRAKRSTATTTRAASSLAWTAWARAGGCGSCGSRSGSCSWLASRIRDRKAHGMNWLGDHSSLILIPLAPLYALLRDARMLLILQSCALAAGAWPVYRLARRELAREWAAACCAALYLLFPALQYSNLFEFHPETL